VLRKILERQKQFLLHLHVSLLGHHVTCAHTRYITYDVIPLRTNVPCAYPIAFNSGR
jgi:hypothetical protein